MDIKNKAIRFLFPFLEANIIGNVPSLKEVGAAREFWEQNYSLCYTQHDQEVHNYQNLDKQYKKLKRELAKCREEYDNTCYWLAEQKYHWAKSMHAFLEENICNLDDKGLFNDLGYFIEFAEKEFDSILKHEFAEEVEQCVSTEKTTEQKEHIEKALSKAKEHEKKFRELKQTKEDLKEDIEVRVSGKHCKRKSAQELGEAKERCLERKWLAYKARQEFMESLVKDTGKIREVVIPVNELKHQIEEINGRCVEFVKGIEMQIHEVDKERKLVQSLVPELDEVESENSELETLEVYAKACCEETDKKLKKLMAELDQRMADPHQNKEKRGHCPFLGPSIEALNWKHDRRRSFLQ